MAKRRIGRPIFRRHEDFVAVRRIRLGGDNYIEPGEPVTRETFKLYHMRSLYQRRKIGVKGHPWTEAMLQSEGFYRPEISGAPADESEFLDAMGNDADWNPDLDQKVLSSTDEMEKVLKDSESGQDPSEETEKTEEIGDPKSADIKAEQSENTQPAKEETKEPVEPVKVGSRWTLPGITDKKFTSKKKALEWRDSEDRWLD